MGNSHVVLRVVSAILVSGNTYKITVLSPRDQYVALPRHFMLWVVDNGTPSTSRWVQVGGIPAAMVGWPPGF